MKDITFDLPIILLAVFAFMMLFPFIPVVFGQEQGLGTSEKIDEGFDWLDIFFKEKILDANLTGTEIPTNTTEDELLDLLDDSVATGKSGKNFLFDFHHLIESFILALAPIDIDPLLVLLISWGVGSLIVFSFTKKSIKHLMIFAVIFGIIILLFMIGGINPEL